MLEPLFSALAQLRDKIAPCTIVHVYETGAVMRLGHYHRTVGPGLCWHWPLIEELTVEHSVITTIRLQPQTCTTKDRRGVVAAGVVKYRLADIEPFVKGVFDQQDVLVDVAMGAVLKEVRTLTFEELIDKPPEDRIATAIRRQVNKFGFEILAFTFTDLGGVRSLRLIQHTSQHEHEHLL